MEIILSQPVNIDFHKVLEVLSFNWMCLLSIDGGKVCQIGIGRKKL